MNVYIFFSFYKYLWVLNCFVVIKTIETFTRVFTQQWENKTWLKWYECKDMQTLNSVRQIDVVRSVCVCVCFISNSVLFSKFIKTFKFTGRTYKALNILNLEEHRYVLLISEKKKPCVLFWKYILVNDDIIISRFKPLISFRVVNLFFTQKPHHLFHKMII